MTPSSAAYRLLSGGRPKFSISWLDLRGSGLSAIERLAIEEMLLRHDPLSRCWAIVGVHEPTRNKLLNVALPSFENDWNATREKDPFGHEINEANRSCAIILGIGGKPEKLIDVKSAKEDGVLVLKRFSGGGTVVIDHSSLWTTLIGRTEMLPDVKPFPREIMKWSAESIFGPAFDSWNREVSSGRSKAPRRGRQTLVFQGKSCGLSGGVGDSLVLPAKEINALTEEQPRFELRENDYVLGDKKIGGNSQSIVKDAFLHHTSFLWDWDPLNMDYLTLPEKRPDYRGDRSHDDFLVRLRHYYGDASNKNSLFAHMKKATAKSFDLEESTLNEVLDIAQDQFGGLQGWWDGKCRTRVMKL